MNKDMEKWENESGVKLMIDLGIEPGHRVLDFGAWVGHYTIPIARVVGKMGAVYAVDKNAEALCELKQKSTAAELKNIALIRNNGDVEFGFRDEIFDALLLFDVLHFFHLEQRIELYGESRRVLKPDSLLLVYPKHTKEDEPSHETRDVGIDNIKQEILNENFLLEKQTNSIISHDDSLNYGTILTFRKR